MRTSKISDLRTLTTIGPSAGATAMIAIWILAGASSAFAATDPATSPDLIDWLPIARDVAVLGFAAGGAILFGQRAMRDQPADGAEGKALAKLSQARSDLDEEMGNALSVMRSQIDSSRRHEAALSRGADDLKSSNDDGQIGAVIRYLLAENEEMRRSNVEYSRRLEESRSQVESLRVQLTKSQELTARDSLTNAYSRNHFDAALGKAVRESDRFGTSLSLVMADLDGFKTINDTFGHLVGDEVLRKLVELMIENTKGSDCVARFGGEEFAIILPSTDLRGSAAVAEKIRAKLEGKEWAVKDGPRLGAVTASFGVAQLNPRETPSNLIRRADGKLYESKAAGRNRVTI
jgi:diguanylate cyclase